ncbi:hypothetical protein B5807_10728 [Epicoccum nigrum]|uniref:Uncharacterized protein n=1 Tax=Epicoccum nigrum TaxID=105696 RepID=A0A1Y2LKZ4_EPING|nr:hypothetical protein B5807_10728 [Epicoccum nigrum]
MGVGEHPAKIAQMAAVEELVRMGDDPVCQSAHAIMADVRVDVAVAVDVDQTEPVVESTVNVLQLGIKVLDLLVRCRDASLVDARLLRLGFALAHLLCLVLVELCGDLGERSGDGQGGNGGCVAEGSVGARGHGANPDGDVLQQLLVLVHEARLGDALEEGVKEAAQGTAEGVAASVLGLCNQRVLGDVLGLVLVLQLCDAVRGVVGVGDVVLVDAQVAARGAQHQVDDLGDGLCLVFVEARNPARGHVLETVAAAKHVGVEASGLVPGEDALADGRLARPAGLLGRAAAAGRAHRQRDALPVRPGLLRRASLCGRLRLALGLALAPALPQLLLVGLALGALVLVFVVLRVLLCIGAAVLVVAALALRRHGRELLGLLRHASGLAARAGGGGGGGIAGLRVRDDGTHGDGARCLCGLGGQSVLWDGLARRARGAELSWADATAGAPQCW